MKAVILSIGDELVLGQTVDTNAAWLSEELAALGIVVSEHVTVADDIEAIMKQLQRCGAETDMIIATGGLGPTTDDLTRLALAQLLGKPLQLHEASFEQIKRFFEQRGRVMSQANRIQAMFPVGCEVLENKLGTAPGIQGQVDRAMAFFLPGVPREMKEMYRLEIQGNLQRMTAVGGVQKVIITRTLHTIGIGESDIAEKLGKMMDRNRNPIVNCTAAGGKVSLRINAHGAHDVEALCFIEPVEREVKRRLGELVYGKDEDTLASVVSQLLRKHKKTVAVAESCTGGMMSKELTDLPGSSEYFKSGWVVYSNRAKTEFLNVDAELIEKYGAVSEEAARQLAGNARQLADSDYGIGITGIAGPDGGSEEKPVGLVYIGLVDSEQVKVGRYMLGGERAMVRRRAVNTALDVLRRRLIDIDKLSV
ncbi:MAG: competence/damage-inducible protein A [Planctomycetes bacterium]|nr:competence/damage-inducible protein A [Planctomycetota bacterium]